MKYKIIMALIVFICLSTLGYASLQNDLIHYWNFEQSNTITDNVGTISADPINLTFTNGKVGKAFYYNGISQAPLSSSIYLQSGTSYSFNLWVKLNDSREHDFMGSFNDTNNLLVADNVGSTVRYEGNANGATSTAYTWDAEWTMLTFTSNGNGSIHFYVDGVDKDSATPNSDMFKLNSLGAGTTGTANWLIGWLDEVGVWNKTLTTDEIAQLYNSGDGYPLLDTFQISKNQVSRWYLNETNADGNVTETGFIEDSWGSNNGTYVNRTFYHGSRTNGLLSAYNCSSMQCLAFDGDYNYSSIKNYAILNNYFNTTERSISFTIYPYSDGEGDAGRIITKNTGWYIQTTDENATHLKLEFLMSFSSGNGIWKTQSRVITKNSNNHVIISYDSRSYLNDPSIYINGTLVALTEISTPSGSAKDDSTGTYIIGNDGILTAGYFGTIDELSFWNRSFSSEINSYFSNTAVPEYNYQLISYYDMNSDHNNKSYDNSHLSTFYINSQKSIMLDGINDYITFNDFNETNGNFLSVFGWIRTKKQYHQTIIDHSDSDTNNKSWLMKVGNDDGSPLRVFLSSDGTSDVDKIKDYYSTQEIGDGDWHHVGFVWKNGSLNLFIDGVNQTDVYKVRDADINTLYNTPINMSIGKQGNTGLNVHFFNGSIYDLHIWNRSIEDYEVNYIYNSGLGLPTGYLNITTTNTINNSIINSFSAEVRLHATNTSIENKSTTNGWINYALDSNFNYDIIITATGYTNQNNTVYDIDIQEGNITFYDFGIYPSNSIMFYFYDEGTNDIMAGLNITTIDLISDTAGYSFNTENGSLLASNIQAENYTFRYYAPGYSQRLYNQKIIDGTFYNFSFYLKDNTSTQQVLATVYKDDGTRLPGVIIKILRYNADDGIYTLQEIVETNFNGEAGLNLVLNTEQYKFILEYPEGTVRKTTNPTYIYRDVITFQINIEEDFGETYFIFEDVLTLLNYSNVSHEFYYEFNDINSIINNSCLEVYRIYSNFSVLVDASCVNTTAGSITITTPGVSGATYRAMAYITIYSDYLFINSYTHSYTATTPFEGKLEWVFLDILLTMVVVLALLKFPSAMLITIPMPTLLLSILNLIPGGAAVWGAALGVEIVFIIISIAIGGK